MLTVPNRLLKKMEFLPLKLGYFCFSVSSGTFLTASWLHSCLNHLNMEMEAEYLTKKLVKLVKYFQSKK